MGSVMSAGVALVGSCLGSCFGACACKLCDSIKPKARDARIPYLFLFVFAIIFGVVMVNYGNDIIFDHFGYVKDACPKEGACAGNQAVFRSSFVLTVFFGLHGILLAIPGTGSVHTSLWLLKVVLFAGALIGCFWIPNSVFTVFADVSRVFSMLFLLAELFLLVDFAYSWNAWWKSNAFNELGEVSNKCWLFLLAGVSFVLLIGSFVGLGFMYHVFGSTYPQSSYLVHVADGGGCSLQDFFITMTILFAFLTTFVAVYYSEHGALLPCGVVTAFATYLCYSALSSAPNSCNPYADAGSNPAQLWIGLIFTVVSICRAAWSMSTKVMSGGETESESSNPGTPLIHPDERDEETGDADAEDKSPNIHVQDPEDEQDERTSANVHEQLRDLNSAPEARKKNMYFHLILAVASMYISMLLTNWGAPGADVSSTASPTSAPVTTGTSLGAESMWVKIVSQWLVFLLYLWTLVAPKLLPDRQFDL